MRPSTGSRLVPVLLGLTLLWLGAALALRSGVAGAASSATFGKTSVGGSAEWFSANRKRVNKYALPVSGAVSELSVYLTTTVNSGQQVLEGIVYADSKGSPGSLLGTTTQLTFTSTSTAGWYRLPFLAPLQLPAGEYWIGVITGASGSVAGYRYDSVAGARDYNANTFTSGPTDPFGSVTADSQQMSLYATYTPTETTPRPANSSLPTISGLAQSGQKLTAAPGSWTESPTSYEYQWQRCDSTGANCAPISGATAQAYTLVAADVGSTLRVAVTATNSGGNSTPASSAQSAVVAQQASTATFGKTAVGASSDTFASERKRVNRYALTTAGAVTKLSVYLAPTSTSGSQVMKGLIYADTGTAPGALLGVSEQLTFKSTNVAGWYELVFSSPVNLAAGNYWIGVMTGATASVAGFRFDSVTGSRDYNANTFASGPTNPFGSPTTDAEQTSLYATYTPQSSPRPLDVSPPTITGTAQEGQTLTEHHGSWTNEPTSYTYQWLRCDSSGNNCAQISGAMSQTYALVAADVGHAIEVQETPSNGAGPGSPATSGATAVVVAPPPPAPTNVSEPTITGTAQQGQTLTEHHGTWTHEPTSFAYQWLQCDSLGNSCLPISGATFQTYVPVTADVGHTLKAQEIAKNAGGPSAPAASNATATVVAAVAANTAPPTIAGTAQQGQTLTAQNGSWTNEPTSFAYAWQRCDSTGANCAPISGAAAQSYVLVAADLGSTLRVSVIATNGGGESAPAISAQSAVVGASSGVSHLEYVVQDGVTSVYDMDHEFKLLKTISLPQTKAEVRGVTVSPSKHLLFISFGGDGGPEGNGSVLAYDLVSEKVLWEVHLSTGIDSGQVSPDGTKLYMPIGENSTGNIWNVLSTENGAVIGTIKGGTAPHNTVASPDGSYVYLEARQSKFLDAYETATGKVKEIGPMINTVRPFTVNGSNTLAFTSATEFDGFQVSSITTGKVLFTVSFGAIPTGFPFTTASHGLSLSPDETQLYVIDAVHKEVQVWDVSKVKEGIAPTQIGVIALAGLTGEEVGCAYGCTRGGWLQRSIDGRYVFVGDSGEVIETATRKVIATLSTLLNTKMSLEIDWEGGVPIATSGRTGAGGVG